MLLLQWITKEYHIGNQRLKVLHGVDLMIEEWSYTAIMWSSWSGKSTLMNIIGMLDTATSGTYEIDGVRVDNISEKRRSHIRRHNIGFVFQNYSLIPRLKVVEQVALPLLYQWIATKNAQDKAAHYLREVWLGDKIYAMPNELSWWQKQRVAIARALVIEPRILLADEPTGALDSTTSSEIMDLMDQLHQQGKTILMITHEKELADRAEHCIIVRDGLVVSD